MILLLAFNWAWFLHQLYASNTFLYVDLEEHVFIEQPLGMLLRGSHQRCLWSESFMGSSKVVVYGAPSLLIFLSNLGSHHVLQIS